MEFTRLRIAGFKSFVEPVDIPVETGLTGVVGPNGCGKSNLLEALRWVMGATSAKALRAGGMDDVIFQGASSRPARNHAEVGLTIENRDRTAPAQFNDAELLEVTRRISRQAGSIYRVNGRETRARDVQLLFADASTGANSPALVRQGQISELVSAKPENRRRVLEEAAGVAGLHSRRHEAELKLKAAEANLARLDDVMGELARRRDALARQAREAARYRKVSLEIRALESGLLRRRWTDARDARDAAREAFNAAEAQVTQTASAAAETRAAALAAGEAMEPLREDEAAAAAVLARIAGAQDALAREIAAAETERENIARRLTEIDRDRDRETALAEDAAATRARIAEEHAAAAKAAKADDKQALKPLEEAVAKSGAARAEAENERDRLAAEGARAEAARAAADRAVATAAARLESLAAELERLDREAEELPLSPPDALAAARAAAATAEAALAKAETALAKAETGAAKAADAERHAAAARAAAAEARAALEAEAKALAASLGAEAAGDDPAADAVAVEPGYERAVAAAFGDDLAASLDPKAPARWAGADVPSTALPKGARALTEVAGVPEALAARASQIGLVESRKSGDALAAKLKPGQRLVSREGDLWRWDGLVVRADAPCPAAARLETRNRLAALDAERDAAAKALKKADADVAKAQTQAKKAAHAVATARAARDTAAAAAREAARTRDALEREAEVAAAKADARATARAKLDRERASTQAEKAQGEKDRAALPAPDAHADDLAAAMEAVASARAGDAEARAALDAARRAIGDRAARAASLARDLETWTARERDAKARIDDLATRRGQAETALEAASAAPAEIETRGAKLAGEREKAEARRAKAGDALAVADAKRREAETAAREADRAESAALQARAGAEARIEAAEERVADADHVLREALGVAPEDAPEETPALAPEEAEKRLEKLRRNREQLGAVNLRADEEADEVSGELGKLQADYDDLTQAIAKLRGGVNKLNDEGRRRLKEAFETVDGHFRALFQTLFGGGEARLALVDSDDPLEAGLDVHVSPPGKKLVSLSLLSGGEQALTATALIFAVFLANPAPICCLDEVDAPLDDANVERFCNLLDEMCRRTATRFLVITHNAVTMARMDRLFGVTMVEKGVSQLVAVDLGQAEKLAAAE